MVVLPVVRLLQLLVTICLVAQPQFAVLYKPMLKSVERQNFTPHPSPTSFKCPFRCITCITNVKIM